MFNNDSNKDIDRFNLIKSISIISMDKGSCINIAYITVSTGLYFEPGSHTRLWYYSTNQTSIQALVQGDMVTQSLIFLMRLFLYLC